MDSLELTRAESFLSTHEQVKNFKSFFFPSLISVQMERKSTKKTQVVVKWMSRVVFKRETVGCAKSQKWFGKTASLHPIATSLTETAKKSQVFQLVKPPLCVHSFSATRPYEVSFVEKSFSFANSS